MSVTEGLLAPRDAREGEVQPIDSPFLDTADGPDVTENVVLLTVDSLRADAFGDDSIHGTTPTPRLDELAAESAVFSQAVANGPNTPSSFPSLLTSTYPLLYGGYRYLDEQRPFVAKTLAAEGFRTVGYHSNPFLGASHNYHVGFENFDDAAEGSDSVAGLKDAVESRLDPDSRLYSFLRRIWHVVSQQTDTAAYASAESVVDDALDWIDGWDGEAPFFTWLHFMDVHYPFMPPDRDLRDLGVEPLSSRRVADLNGRMQEDPASLSEDDVADLRDLYYGELRFTDRQIGRLLDRLEELGLREETAVVFTADHGEAFGEHDRFGHHPYLYDELLRVPLVVSAPELGDATVDSQVSLIDVGPTIYDLVDVPTPEAVQGESLLPLAEGTETEDRVAISAALNGQMLACRTTEWKCFWRVEDDVVELYDLEADPGETRDVSDEHPEVVSRFRETMTDHLDAAEQTDVSLPEIEEGDATRQRLRDLGYLE